MPPPWNGSAMVTTDAGMPQHATGPACELSVVVIDASEREPKPGPCEQWDEPVAIEPFHGRCTFMHTEDLDLTPAAVDGIENEAEPLHHNSGPFQPSLPFFLRVCALLAKRAPA